MKTSSFISAALLLASAPIAMATPAPGLEDQSPLVEARWLNPNDKCKPTKTVACLTAFKRDIEALSIGSSEKRDTSSLDESPQVLKARVLRLGNSCRPRKGIKCAAKRDPEDPQVLEARVVGWGRTCKFREGARCLARKDLQGLVAGGRASLEAGLI